MTPELLSRIQFAFTITFHYIYPPMSIGISLMLVWMEGLYLWTRDPRWERATKFWLRVFSLTFALGIATGIPMQFSLGTSWCRYANFCGDVFGSLLGAEGFFAFFIEAGFLGLLLFGWNCVTPIVHFIATIFVSLGTHFSAIWIVSVNSWMHTPAGYRLAQDASGKTVAQVSNWWEMFLNPSNLSHITHVLLSAWMTGAFLMISVGAYYYLKHKHMDFAKRSLWLGLGCATTCCMLQLVSADNLARNVATHNPETFASLEGVFKTEKATPIYLFGWVDEERERVIGVPLPGMLSFLTYRNFETPVRGLDQFPKSERPWVGAVFQLYHMMVASWFMMTALSSAGLYFLWKGTLAKRPLLLRGLVLSVALPHIGNLTGWYTSCMGRQPWTVHKLLRTSDSYSNNVPIAEMWIATIGFVIVYLLFFALFLVLLDKKIKHGPETHEEQLPYRDPYTT